MAMQKIELTERQRAFIKTVVDNGAYRDENEVVGEALRRLEYQEACDHEKLAHLRLLVRRSEEQLEQGAFTQVDNSDEIDLLMDTIDRKVFESPER